MLTTTRIDLSTSVWFALPSSAFVEIVTTPENIRKGSNKCVGVVFPVQYNYLDQTRSHHLQCSLSWDETFTRLGWIGNAKAGLPRNNPAGTGGGCHFVMTDKLNTLERGSKNTTRFLFGKIVLHYSHKCSFELLQLIASCGVTNTSQEKTSFKPYLKFEGHPSTWFLSKVCTRASLG